MAASFARFSVADDIELLREVRECNPFANPLKWAKIARTLSEYSAKAFTARAVRERAELLLSQYAANDRVNLRNISLTVATSRQRAFSMEHDPCVGSSSRSKVSPAADEPAVECGMDQADELRSLGVHTACNQADLEQGVLEEMDRIVQQKEAQEQRRAIEKEVLAVRRSITVARRRLEQLEKSVCFDQLAASRYVPSEIFTRRRHDKVLLFLRGTACWGIIDTCAG
ncbi:hypothetical protein V5799_006921 [Amblyomma americanum]|uniref:Uncharacterized protein n=1 Tax=Amblyomma americanum TaxID=6943 RepID=A0AAQ4DV11_AMBAM